MPLGKEVVAPYEKTKVDFGCVADSALLVLRGVQVSYANGLACCILGFPFYAIEGHSFLDFVHAEDRPRVAEALTCTSEPNSAACKVPFRLGAMERKAFARIQVRETAGQRTALLQINVECDSSKLDVEARLSGTSHSNAYFGHIVHELSQPIHASQLQIQQLLQVLSADRIDQTGAKSAALSVERYLRYAALVTQYLSAHLAGNQLDINVTDIGKILDDTCQKLNALVQFSRVNISYQSRVPILVSRPSNTLKKKLQGILATIVFGLLGREQDSQDNSGIRRIDLSAQRNQDFIEIDIKFDSDTRGEKSPAQFLYREAWANVTRRISSTMVEEVQSGEGKGSVTLTIDNGNIHLELSELDGPIGESKISNPEVSVDGNPVDHRTRTALVVEDQVDVRNLTCDLLRELEFEVVEAGDAEQALTGVRGAKIDLIVTDFGLPGLDGISLIRQLRSEGYACPSILMSGYLSQTNVHDRLKGIADVIIVPKPADINVLEAAIIAATR